MIIQFYLKYSQLMDLGPGLNNYINNYFIFCWSKRSNQDQCYVLMMIKWKISGTCHPEHLSCSIGAYLSILQRCSWSLFPAASTSRTSLLLHNLSAGAEARGLQTENSPWLTKKSTHPSSLILQKVTIFMQQATELFSSNHSTTG